MISNTNPLQDPNINIAFESITNQINYSLNSINGICSISQHSITGPFRKVKYEVSEYDGNLKPIYPEQFLEQLIQYLQDQIFSETQTIQIAVCRLTQNARS